MASQNEFEGKVAVVTGATSGMGRAAVVEFAAAGTNVVAAGRRIEQGEALVAETESLVGKVVFVRTDVTVGDDVKRMVDTAVDSFGGLDFAFNNAGGVGSAFDPEKRLHQLDESDWDYFSDMFLKSVWRCMKYQIKVMLPAGKGVIINNASIAGIIGASLVQYGSMKHGVVGLTKGAMRQYSGEGIRFNAVCPGWIDTEMTGHWKNDPEVEDRFFPRQNLKRPGESKEVASLVKWLCSDSAAFVDGVALPIDGGFSA